MFIRIISGKLQIKELTFWDRKAVAQEVGKGGVTRLLLELDEITNCRNKKKADCRFDNVMVVIGHSFGGAIVVSALSDVLTERVVDRKRPNRTRPKGYARTIGDGVLVLNPAIEANQALSFVEAAIKQSYAPEQYPVFISLSSDADWATHYAFPLGQTLGLLLTWEQEDLERSYYYDRLKPDEKIAMYEEHLDATTVGNFAPFLTHRLTSEGSGEATRFRIETCEEFPEGCKPRGLTTRCGQPAIRNLPDNYPLYFFKTDDTMMEGHNCIFNENVRSFIITIIDDVVRHKLARPIARRFDESGTAQPSDSAKLEPSILVDPAKLKERMETIFREMPRDTNRQACD